ncbi:MAG: DEAD/DEAH box helicase family protein, partial [Methylococcales bacterium]|nr:DEAD/DEAH box helicase family protein [Methylococcales bacterium]
DDYNNLQNKNIDDVIKSARYKLEGMVKSGLFGDTEQFKESIVNDMLERLMSGTEDNSDFKNKVVVPELRRRYDQAQQRVDDSRKQALNAEKEADTEDYDNPKEPKWSNVLGFDATMYNQEKAAKKIASWVKTLSESQVHSASAFSRALNQSKLSDWLSIERGRDKKDLYFYLKNKGIRITPSDRSTNHLSLINTIMKMANQAIFDSVDGYDYFSFSDDDDYFLDDTTTMQTSIQTLKSQFPANNGMGKIALARQIIELRQSTKYVYTVKNISDYFYRADGKVMGRSGNKNYGIINSDGLAASYDGQMPSAWRYAKAAKEIAQYEAGKFKWVKLYNSIEEAKQGKNNAPSTNEILERNSQTPRNANSGNEKPVRNDGSANGTNTGTPSATANQAGNQQQGDNRVSTDSPVIAGTQSDSSVVKGDGDYRPARTVDDTGSGDVSGSGISDDRQRNETVAGIAQGTKKLDRAVKLALQAQAEGIDYEPTEENIRATLPFLLPEQQDDIVKIEARFKENHGMLITNGTGTGKTYSALGAVKRFQKQGKHSILIVVPNDKIGQDFIDSAVNMKLTIKLLDGIKDNGGSGISITTY